MKKRNMATVAGWMAVLLLSLSACGKNRGEEILLPTLSEDALESVKKEAFLKEPADETEASLEDTGEAIRKAETTTVYICGEVKKPGVYELPEESRIVDALIAADGFTENAAGNYLNQAAPLSDGEMIYVPSKEELLSDGMAAGGALVAAGSGQSTVPESGGLVNINTADKAQLMTITGVGEAKAETIIAYREESGSFRSIEDIMNVPGIKEGMFNKIKDQICVK
ncbi:MAG: ComEA family DNA-binding protein [Lachnospiraceae bacterium]|nr:ComEA family DNA-binding protein [Lachnospiraceae bacterium]